MAVLVISSVSAVAMGNVWVRILYVVKQKCTTANVVIYSDISLFYYQKFFFVVIVQIYFLLIIVAKTPNLIGGQVVQFCLTTYKHQSKYTIEEIVELIKKKHSSDAQIIFYCTLLYEKL